MDATKKWRFRFWLRGLLALVAVCALVSLVYSWLPNSVTQAELRRLRKGMPQAAVVDTLGQPDDKGYDDEGYVIWRYGFLGVVIIFDNDGAFSETDNFKHSFNRDRPNPPA